MTKILTAVIISVMLVVCSCGANKNSADNAPAAQSNETEQAEAEAAQVQAEAETVQAEAEAETVQAHIPHRYASRSEGQALLMSNEDYYAGFSQNELEFKMQKKGGSMEEYKAFAVEQVVDFTQEEIDAADALFGEMEETLTANGYTLPPIDEIILVKTTMAEECDVTAYTHGTQIYLAGKLLKFNLSDPNDKDSILNTKYILWHEIFHCLTRCNPDFREEMYKLIHFTVQEEDYPLPPSVFEYHISNPDVEHHNSYATFIIDGQNVDCFTDFVTTKHFEREGDDFFDCATTALVPVDGSDIYYTPEQAENFDEVFGTNTDYVVDPEECMADNFGYALAYGMDGPKGDGYSNPEIIEGIMDYLCGR